MKLELRLSTEPVRVFHGPLSENVPYLISGRDERGKFVDVERIPAPLAFIFYQRLNGDIKYREKFRNHSFFSDDVVLVDKSGNLKFALDSGLVSGIGNKDVHPSKRSSFVGYPEYVRTVTDEVFEELSGKKVLSISKEEVDGLFQKGYIRCERTGNFIPEDDKVEEILEHLSRGRVNLSDYGREIYGEFNTFASYRLDKEKVFRVMQIDHLYPDPERRFCKMYPLLLSEFPNTMRSMYNRTSKLICGANSEHQDAMILGITKEVPDKQETESTLPKKRKITEAIWEYLGSIDVRNGLPIEELENCIGNAFDCER